MNLDKIRADMQTDDIPACAKTLAQAWYDGTGDELGTRVNAELSGVDFSLVEIEFGKLYEEGERTSCQKFN